MVRSGRVLNVVKTRAARARELAHLDARPGLRRELLTMDYVLPVRRRYSPSSSLQLRTKSPSASGTLFFGRDSFAVDRVAYFGVFLEGWYRADYRGATVLDVGGHKGYYGAFAIHEGAAVVHSYEPESTNFSALTRASETFGRRWIPHRAAVGAVAGEATLHVNAESAGHSIVHEQSDGPRPTVGSQTVPVVPMQDLLRDTPELPGRLIVKIDAEGAECDIVLGTSIELWRRVDHIFLEVHDFAPCPSAAIVAHLEQAGLEVVLHAADPEAELIGLARRHPPSAP